MKKFLSMLSVLTLAGTSIIGSTVLTKVDSSNIKTSKTINYFDDYATLNIKSPVVNISFLTTAGDWGTARQEWAYTTINLGQLKSGQIMGIGSKNNDSYTEHKVNDYNYHLVSKEAGIHHGPNFRTYFIAGKADPTWTYYQAAANANYNFNSETTKGWAKQWAMGSIKFMWYYNDQSELLIDIVGTLYVGAYWSSSKSIASIKLGSEFTIYYTK